MRTAVHFFLILMILSLAGEATDGGHDLTLRGFTPAHSQSERSLEQKFLAVPNPERAEAIHKILTAEPHPAGSLGDRRTAEYMLKQFRSYGLDAEIEQFKVLDSEPGEIKFQLLVPEKFSGPHSEYVPEDPASRDRRSSVGFNAYSGSGDVASEVVYANYGLPADYEFLQSTGISVAGKIVIVRYGACYRGVKARIAEENKVAGLIIYSDPQNDGYHVGDSYPRGPWRPASGVQRGSVLYEFILPGTVAADGSNIPHLPIMPLSYADAEPILKNIQGVAAPRDWQGGLPFTYHVGPGPAKVRMLVRMNQVVRSIWNVIAKIHGTQDPEAIVLAGNHRDAWVYGGADPNSGTTALLEMAHGLGALVKEDWHPRRSIWLCSWDGEELGEFGSVVWAEKYTQKLNHAAVAYLNTDTAVSGDRLSISASPSLKRFILEVAADIPDPVGGSVLERANEQLRERLRQQLVPGHPAASRPTSVPIAQQEFQVKDLGGGTDFIAFFDHLGIPSTDMQFDGLAGEYHSIFDNHRWMKKFGDPEFLYHVASARLFGLMTMRLAEADLLPLDYATYGQEIESNLEGIHNKLVLLGRAGELDLQAAEHAAQELTQVAWQLADRYDPSASKGTEPTNLYEVNRNLVKAEEAFLLAGGLPGRPWYKHALFAPGTYNGYDPVALPGMQESVDAGNFDEARTQLEEIKAALHRATVLLQSTP
jgi:N-acetylated-alpha-linked acidic dipeptidase